MKSFIRQDLQDGHDRQEEYLLSFQTKARRVLSVSKMDNLPPLAESLRVELPLGSVFSIDTTISQFHTETGKDLVNPVDPV